MWEALCTRWQAGAITAPEIACDLQVSEFTVYKRLHEAEQRLELRVLDANQAVHESRRAAAVGATASPSTPRHGGPDIDDGTFLTLVGTPLDASRPVRDYSRDKIHGEPRYAVRPYYHLGSDRTSLDGQDARVLVGGGAIRYDSSGAGRQRLPSPSLAGQRLKVERMGGSKPAQAPLQQYAAPDDGLTGGVNAPTAPEIPPGQHLWAVALPDGREVKVAAKTKVLAKRAAKSLLKWESAKPLPTGTRVRCVG